MNKDDLSLISIRDKMEVFHKMTAGRLPNTIILPAWFKIYEKEKIADFFGCKIVFASVDEICVGLIQYNDKEAMPSK